MIIKSTSADLRIKMLLAQEELQQLADCIPLLYRQAGTATTVAHKEFGWKLAANIADLESRSKNQDGDYTGMIASTGRLCIVTLQKGWKRNNCGP